MGLFVGIVEFVNLINIFVLEVIVKLLVLFNILEWVNVYLNKLNLVNY